MFQSKFFVLLDDIFIDLIHAISGSERLVLLLIHKNNTRI